MATPRVLTVCLKESPDFFSGEHMLEVTVGTVPELVAIVATKFNIASSFDLQYFDTDFSEFVNLDDIGDLSTDKVVEMKVFTPWPRKSLDGGGQGCLPAAGRERFDTTDGAPAPKRMKQLPPVVRMAATVEKNDTGAATEFMVQLVETLKARDNVNNHNLQAESTHTAVAAAAALGHPGASLTEAPLPQQYLQQLLHTRLQMF